MEASKQSQVGAEVSESSRRRQDGGTAVTKQAQQQERLRGGRGRCAGPDGRLRAEARRSRLPDFYTRRLGVGRMPLFQGWGRQVDEEWYWALSSHTRSENMLGPLRETNDYREVQLTRLTPPLPAPQPLSATSPVTTLECQLGRSLRCPSMKQNK